MVPPMGKAHVIGTKWLGPGKPRGLLPNVEEHVLGILHFASAAAIWREFEARSVIAATLKWG